jgi:hypothetical protein
VIELRQSLIIDTAATERHPNGYEDPETRCSRPGQPYRNVTNRCEHGFLDGKNCVTCNPVAREEHHFVCTIKHHHEHPEAIKRKNDRRREALRQIGSGVVDHYDLSRVTGASPKSTFQQVKQLKIAGYVTDETGRLVITESGMEFMRSSRLELLP